MPEAAEPKLVPAQSVERLFGIYKLLWINGPNAACELVTDLLAEQGLGVVNGFLVPDGSYFNEYSSEIDGKIQAFNRVWKRSTGWRRADDKANVEW